MRNALKWIAIVLGSLIAVVGLAIAYLAATFDPNDYKARIVTVVQEKTGRKLDLKDIKLSYLPSLGVRVNQASLLERGRDAEFASFEEAFVAVKLLPLLAKQVIVDKVEVKGARVRIEKNKAGEFNFEDLKGAQQKGEQKKDEKPTALSVDIDHITLSNSEITYIDRAADSEYRLSGVNLRTGRIAAAVTTPIEFDGTLAAPKQKAQVDVTLKTRLTMDPQRQIYRLDNLDLSSKGNLENLSGMQATARGRLEARLATNEYLANGFQLDVSGKRAGGDIKLKVEAPKLTLTKDKVEGGKIVLDATVAEPKSKLALKAAVPGVQGTFNAFRTEPINADIEMQGDGRTTTAKLTGTATGDLEAKRFQIPDLKLMAKVTDPKLPKGSFDGSISGSAHADMTQETAGLEFSGRLDESNVTGKAGVTRFSPLALTFDLNADELDVDRLMGKTGGSKQADKARSKDKDEKIDLSALETVNAAGTIRIAKLNAMNLKSQQVRADIKVANGRLDVSPLAAQLYQGTLKGSLSAVAANNATFSVKQTLSGVAVGPLLRDAAQIDMLDGRGTVSADLSTQGSTVDALKKALDGTAAVNLANGSLKGVDIAGTIRAARASLDQIRGRPAQQSSDRTQKTDFTELKATFKIRDGVAHNNDFSMKSPLLRASGAGDIDIGNERLNYVLKATIVATSKGQGGRDTAELKGVTVPVQLTGAFDAPQWSIDFAGMATGYAQQRLQDEILRRVPGGAAGGQADASKKGTGKSSGVEDAVRGGLKGIFGR